MKSLKKHLSPLFLSLLLITAAISASSSPELSLNVETLVDYETRANAASQRSNQPVKIEHYEIPYELVEKEISERTPKDVLDSLVFEKNGEKLIRWVINPEDTRWQYEVKAWLESQGVRVVKGQYFTGYKTASRSYIIIDPNTEVTYSIKVSTNMTGGMWRDKKQTWADASQIKMAADYVAAMTSTNPPKHFIVMDEPVVFGIKALDQGMVLRMLSGLFRNEMYYIPGFSALHEIEGRYLAKLNGSGNPREFWLEHYIKPLARAIAELAVKTGLTYDSPHSQNFLIELDSNFRPTGRIVFRDLGDLYATAEFFKAINNETFLQRWETGNVLKGFISIGQGVLHGNAKPSWISEGQYDAYGKTFFVEVEKEISRLTGIPIEQLLADGGYRKNGNYFTKAYILDKPGWKLYLKHMKELDPLGEANPCAAIFRIAN
jgi:hypothetical protein